MATFCFFVLRKFIKFAITVQATNNIKKAFAVLKAMEGARNSFSQIGELAKKKRMQLCPRAEWIFSKALTKSGRACCNPIASGRADGVNTHQVRTKTTYGANSKKVRRYSAVRSCSCTMKGMVLGLEGCLVSCAYEANKTQHRNRINLEVAQSLNQALGRRIDVHHALDDFSGCRLTVNVTIWADHGSNVNGMSDILHLTELFAFL